MHESREETHAPEEASQQVRRQFSWKIVPMAAITGLVIYVLVSRIAGAGDLAATLDGAQWGWAPVPIALIFVAFFIASVRFKLVAAAMGYTIGLGRAFDALIATFPFGLITPSRASDLLRAVVLRDEMPVAEGASSVIAERLVDVQSLCLIGITGCALLGQWAWMGLLVLALLAEWTVVLLLAANIARVARLPLLRRFESKVQKIFAAFEALRDHPRTFLAVSAVSIVAWLTNALLAWTLFEIFNAQVSFGYVAALWPVALFVGMLPLTVAGMGTRDAAFVGLLGLVGADFAGEASVLAGTLGYAFVSVIVPAIVGLPFMFKHMRRL